MNPVVIAVAQTRPNTALKRILAELGWSPRDLSRHLNREFGAGTVSPTAPYHWRDSGRVPHQPMPQLIACLLSQQLGRTVGVAELWGHGLEPSPSLTSAGDGLREPVTRAGILAIIDDWVKSGLIDRRLFLAISGGTLVDLASVDVYRAPSKPVSGGAPILDQIEATVPLLQRLDDASGGGQHLSYVGAHFRTIAMTVRDGHHTTVVERGLLTALTDVGQLAGWMAFDAGDHGLAQRYYLTALHVARHVGYRPMAGHILADLAFQAATREHPGDAVTLGERAAHVTERSSPAVRASVRSRLAYAYAVAGRLDEFQRAYQAAHDALATSGGTPNPAWMYFLTPSHLDAQAGYALIHAATRARAGRGSHTREMLQRWQRLLGRGAHAVPLGDPSERRALYEGAWLGVAAAYQGDFELACRHGHTAVQRLANVRSRRSTDVLTLLVRRLRRATRNPYAADFSPTLENALTRQGTV